ncbi:glycosyltransferase [Candidatus Dependentiae bacterium]|nr:glycosyltransferase [Candidatus Dependentiae bacterium]
MLKKTTKHFKSVFFISFSLSFLSAQALTQPHFDLTVVGFILFGDGIGRQSIGVIDCLKESVSVNFKNTRAHYFKPLLDDVPLPVATIIQQSPDSFTSSVSLLEDVLINGNSERPELYYKLMPASTIKLAYTMFESTSVPASWPAILNTYFDAAVLPDSFLVDIYKKSGVTIPLFVVPLGVYLEDFLAKPLKNGPGAVFTFGNAGTFCDRKNTLLLIESFTEAFKNKKNIQLKLHGRCGDTAYIQQIQQKIAQLKATTISISFNPLPWSGYVDFMSSLDCYVSLSKGEGFSIAPRESLALGIPCIVSNNTGQTTICNSNYVYAIASPHRTPAYYPHLQKQIGYNFNCSKQSVVTALKEVYNNYSTYLKKSHLGRKWSEQYLYKNLKPLYLNLIKPKQVVFGKYNHITAEYLMTNSKKLYNKYLSIGS